MNGDPIPASKDAVSPSRVFHSIPYINTFAVSHEMKTNHLFPMFFFQTLIHHYIVSVIKLYIAQISLAYFMERLFL